MSTNTSSGAYRGDLYVLFQIVDPQYFEESDSSDFDRYVAAWIKRHPSKWEIVCGRFNYCDSLFREGKLGTDIDTKRPDVRWEVFIRYGMPKDELILQGGCVQSDTGCPVWMFTWPADSLSQTGREVSCRSNSGESYPNEIISNGMEFPVAYPIWPFVNYSIFPADDETVDLWFGVWVPGDQFTGLTLGQGLLAIQIYLYDSTKTVLIDSGLQVSNLQMIRGILETVQGQERRFIRAMGYIGFSKLQPGTYNARLSVCGARDNEGQSWIKVVIPPDKKVSDLLLLKQSLTTGENVMDGILRGDQVNLYDNPECRLLPRAKFDLYLEATLPKGHSKNYEVWVTLLRIPEILILASTKIVMGKAVVVADSLEQPFTDGKWQSPESQKLLADMSKSDSESGASKTITIFKKKFEATDDRITVQVAPHLKSNLRSGKYLLTVTITNPKRQNYFLSARRVIRIAPTSAFPQVLRPAPKL